MRDEAGSFGGSKYTKPLGSNLDLRERPSLSKEMAMDTKMKRRTAQPLLHSTSDDGTRWLYVVHHGNGWEIMRNGARVERGPAGARSIQAGVDRFLIVTRSPLVAEDPQFEETATARSA
jgi:hypothetical protein